MAENQVYLIKSGQNSFVEETQAIVGISGGKVGIGTTVPESFFHVAGDTQIDGDLTVKGNFTTIESTTIQVDDKNIELGVGSTSDVAADGGGITLHGATNKTFNWSGNNSAWTSSEHLYLANGKHFSADELRALDADGLKLADQTTSGILIKDGKVGIHQTSPAYDLDVSGSGNFDSLYIQGNSVLTGDGSIFGKWEDGATAGEIYYNEGNVGIGAIDPSAQLHVVGSTLLSGIVSASGINAIDAGGLTLGDDAGNGIFVEDGGQVGIGTTAPGYNLDVVGNGNFSQGLYVNGNSVLTGSAADLGKWDEGANSKIFYNDGNVGVGTSDPSVKFEVVGDSLFNGDLSVGSSFSVSTNGSVGGVLPTSAGQVVGWDGSKWRPVTSVGGGGSSSEVPEAFVQSLASGQSEYTINFTQTYDSAPAISTDLQIDGAGDIIPYAISEVTTSGYSISFAKDLPNNNYKIHTNFGGRDVYWTTGALGSINYSGGDVSIQDSLSVGANLTVQGNAVLTGSAADLGKWDEGVGSEIYYSDGNVGVGTSNPSYTLHVNGTIYNENGELNVANKFNVSSLGAVGGQSPAFNEVIKWDGSKWIAGSAPGGGTASSSEVPSAFDTWLSAGSTLHPITFIDAPEGGYQSIPSISTDVEIVEGDIIPYAISGVSTTGYYAVFSDPIPSSNNYKIHTTFGGKEVYWKTGAGGSSIYYDGDSVSVDDLVVGGNLTVNGTTTTVNTQTVEIEDHNLVIAANTGYNQLTSEYPGAGGAYAGILWGTGDAGEASPVSLTYQTNKGFAFEGGNVGIGTKNPVSKLEVNLSNGTYISAKESAINQVCGYAINGNAGTQTAIFSSNTATGEVRLGGTLANYYQTFYTHNSERMRITSGGNVGIGHTSPGGKLHVTDLNVSIGSVTVTDSGTGVTGGTALDTKISNGDRIKINGEIFTVSNVAATTLTLSDTPSTAGTFTAYTDNNGLIVTSAGNVGIGTPNPSAKLSIHTSGATAKGLQVRTDNGDADSIRTVGGGGDNDVKFIVKGSGNVGIGTTNPDNSDWNVNAKILHIHKNDTAGGMIKCSSSVSSLIFSAGNNIGYIGTSTNHDLGLYTNKEQKMTIKAGGNVGIGTRNPTAKLYVNGSTWSTTGWSSSDDRVKHNEQAIVGAIETLGKLAPKKYIKTTEMYEANHDFELDADGNPVDANGEPVEHSIEAGVIAQQVLGVPELAFMVSPEGVDEDGNVTSPHGLNYNSLFTYAIAAIQEQQSIIEDLKSQNASLAAQNADFESRISQLEQ